jgi:hypothetical protein
VTTINDTALLGADDTQAGQYLAGDGPQELQPASDELAAPLAPADLVQANAALARENAELKQAAQGQRLGKLVGELRFLGKLTPGLEQAGALALLETAYSAGAALRVDLPDGTALPLGDALANLLYAIPPSWGGGQADTAAGSAAAPARHAETQTRGRGARAAGSGFPLRLSAQEHEIARTLGLTAEEYASVISDQ